MLRPLSRWILLVALLLPMAAQAAGVPKAKHVFLVVLENQNYDSIMNGSMPFLDSLAREYAVGANYFANAHPSIGNYFMLTTGDIPTRDDNFNGQLSGDNLVRSLETSGKTWRAYAQGLPSVGFLGNRYPYMRRHDPFAYFSNVADNPTERNNIVPLQQFTSDLASGQLADFVYLLPDFKDDMHDCPQGGSSCSLSSKESAADTWLRRWLEPLMNSDVFKDDGLLIITFDESENDNRHGGGLVPIIVAGPQVKHGYESSAFYQHQNTLRTMCDALRLKSCPGSAAQVQPMGDLFQ